MKSDNPSSNIVNKATTKIIEEKKQREHLLQLNQILAKQVMEMSKIVAGRSWLQLLLKYRHGFRAFFILFYRALFAH